MPVRVLALILGISLLLPLTGCTATRARTVATTITNRAPGAPVPPGTRMSIRTTAYTHTEAGGSRNAIGGRLRFGGAVSSAASDWSWLPLGTRFRLVGSSQVYVIEDYGSALVGRKTVDLYKPSMKSMRAWGVRHVEIEILEWGSKVMSLKLLEPRQKRSSHVRKMVISLRQILSTRKPAL